VTFAGHIKLCVYITVHNAKPQRPSAVLWYFRVTIFIIRIYLFRRM